MNRVELVQLFRCISPLCNQLQGVLHRDVTQVAYSQWLRLYLDGLRACQIGLGTMSGGRSSSSTQGCDADIPPETAVLTHALKQTVNAMLLSSLVTPRWELVHCPRGVEELERLHTVPKRWQLHGGGAVVADSSGHVTATGAEIAELFTPQWMAEPLLGGSALTHWNGALRQQPRLPQQSATASAQEDPVSVTPQRAPAHLQSSPIRLVLPFSTLWQLKWEAHPRPAPAMSHSLQERRARLTLLQTIAQLMELQDAMVPKERGGESSHHSLCSLQVLSPSEEFDAICRLPHFVTQYQDRSGSSSCHKISADTFNLRAVCEHLPTRLAYLTHDQNRRSQELRGGQQAIDGAQGHPAVTLVGHSSELPMFRTLGLSLVRERSLLSSTALHLRAPRRHSVPVSAHRQALQDCSETIRRLTAREENIRQSFSQH